jgi:hypothetical protein
MKQVLKERLLLTMQRFNENLWRPLTAFPLTILDKVSSRGSTAGIAASSHRGSTLKGTKVSNLYLLTPWSRFLLEKLTVNFAASQEIPRMYGTRKFLTVHTRAHHLSLS